MEIKLNNLCHIIQVTIYRAQNGLKQWRSCEQLVHVSANCKQRSHWLRCGWSHLHSNYMKKQFSPYKKLHPQPQRRWVTPSTYLPRLQS